MTAAPVPAVKVCGLTRPEDAAFAETQGARYLGVILASGPRLLTPERARLVLGPPRASLARVGVFGDQPDDLLLAQADRIALDVLQLHGARAPDAVQRLAARSGRTVWPVVRVAGTVLPGQTLDLALVAGTLVLDTLVAGQLGGTGVALDWQGLRDALTALRADTQRHGVPLRVVLAGGLRPETVGTAIRLLGPDVVDVSSGVECAPGVKDPVRVEQFVQAVRATAETQR